MYICLLFVNIQIYIYIHIRMYLYTIRNIYKILCKNIYIYVCVRIILYIYTYILYMWNFHSYPWCELPVCLGLAYELHALPVMWPVKSWWGRGRDVVGRRMASWWNIGGCGFLLVDRVTNWTGFIIYLCWEQTSFGNSVFHLILINRVDPILCEVGDPKGELPVCVVTHHSHW